MAPAIAGTMAVDRAIELAKRVHDKLGESITEFKLTEDYEVVPLECPEPGLHCKITPRGILVVGAIGLGIYALYTLSMGLKAYFGTKESTVQTVNNMQNWIPGNPIGLIKWLTGVKG